MPPPISKHKFNLHWKTLGKIPNSENYEFYIKFLAGISEFKN
jgi:hypothetical protein